MSAGSKRVKVGAPAAVRWNPAPVSFQQPDDALSAACGKVSPAGVEIEQPVVEMNSIGSAV
jgi:hypothetical protein